MAENENDQNLQEGVELPVNQEGDVETPVVAEEASVPAAKTATAAPAAEKATSKKYVAPPKQEGEIAIPSLVLPDDTWGEDEDDDIGDGTGYSKVQRAKFESIYESTLKELNENEIVSGTIVSIGEKEVVLNIGFKSEGVVPINEFRDLDKVKIGDAVEVYLESVEDQDGQLVLSRKRAKHMRTWARVMKAEEEDVILEGLIRRRTKGGFVVEIDGIEAFLPGSQIDVKPVRDFDAYVGKTMDFKVVKINHQNENVVISHKVLIEKDLEKQRQEILKNLEKGQVLEGTVKNMTAFGAFIDLGGVDGLLHITDISWGRINDPREVLELDQKINVVVLDFDENKNRISLGLKQLEAHPWDSLPEDIAEGSKINGRVVTVADYGIFVEIMPGVEGLVHMSEMSWSQHLKNPTELFKIGDEVEATVLSIDRDERKMSLGLKQALDDPWLNAAGKYAVGSRHTGLVRNMTNYGLFVELEEGVDGLVHISDLSWTKKYNHPSEFIKKDEQLEVIVLDIDVANRRLSLGHKQLTEDVWETFETIFVVGSSHEGTILSVNDKGATIELQYGVEGFIPRKHLVAENGHNIKPGEALNAVVIEFSKDAKKLVLSHAMTWNEEMAAEQDRKKTGSTAAAGGKGKKQSAGKKSGSKASSPKVETTTLGDIAALAALKEQLEAAEKGDSPVAEEEEEAVEDVVEESVEDVVVEDNNEASEEEDSEEEEA